MARRTIAELEAANNVLKKALEDSEKEIVRLKEAFASTAYDTGFISKDEYNQMRDERNRLQAELNMTQTEIACLKKTLTKLGRPLKITQEDIETIRKLHSYGRPLRDISESIGCSLGTVHRIIHSK